MIVNKSGSNIGDRIPAEDESPCEKIAGGNPAHERAAR
jgi:hypothetical protein